MGAWVRWDLPVAAARFGEWADAEPGNDFARRMRQEATAELSKAYLAIGDGPRAIAAARRLVAWPDVDPTLLLDAAEVLARAGAVDEARAVASPLAARHAWRRAKRLSEQR